MRAFVFPGQGSQKVGMGAELAEASAAAREVFEEVDDALGQALSKLMRDGPEDELTLTENAQPAIMANAIAVLRVLESEAGITLAEKCDLVAGHSLGEYTALCAAGSFSLADTARLLKRRGQAMQAAVPVGVGAMAALLGADMDKAQALADAAARGEVCTVANDNDATQVVISGHTGAIERAIALVKEHGIKRGVPLPVSAPFHCELMQPAADAMAQALDETPPSTLRVPLFANVTATMVSDPAEIQRLLVEQITGRVRWRESAIAMAEAGAAHFVEFGGKVVGPMIKRSAGDVETVSVVSMEDIETLAKELSKPMDQPMFDLHGMNALVTGASGGIGSAIARALARQGARIAVSGSNAEKLRVFRDELDEHSPQHVQEVDHVAIACDLSRPEEVEKLVPAAIDTLGSLDILVNNAGITRDNLAMRMKDEEWQQVIQVNLEAAFRLMRAAARPMMKARFGRIITVTSVVGATGNPGQMNYAAAKGGLTAMSKSLGQELATRGITVNCIAPGFIRTAMTDILPDATKDELNGRIPMGRMGEGEDIGAAAVYLASREAGYVTGQTLHVNGGMAMLS